MTKQQKKMCSILVILVVLLLILLAAFLVRIQRTKDDETPMGDMTDEYSEELLKMSEEELKQKLYDNAIATQFMENYTGNEGYKIYKYKSDKTFKVDKFSNSVTSLLYNESDAVKNLNYEVLTKWAADERFDVSEIEAVGSEFAQDAYGIVHYTYVGPTAVARVFFVLDLQTRHVKGYLEVVDTDEG